jgi:uncharacterized protein YcfL
MKLAVILMGLVLTGCGSMTPRVETRYEVVVQTKYVPVGIEASFFDKGDSLTLMDVTTSTQKDVSLFVADLYSGYVQRGIRLDTAKAENAAKLADVEAKNAAEAKRVKAITEVKPE